MEQFEITICLNCFGTGLRRGGLTCMTCGGEKGDGTPGSGKPGCGKIYTDNATGLIVRKEEYLKRTEQKE